MDAWCFKILFYLKYIQIKCEPSNVFSLYKVCLLNVVYFYILYIDCIYLTLTWFPKCPLMKFFLFFEKVFVLIWTLFWKMVTTLLVERKNLNDVFVRLTSAWIYWLWENNNPYVSLFLDLGWVISSVLFNVILLLLTSHLFLFAVSCYLIVTRGWCSWKN